MRKEFEQLPETLKGLEPKDRLNILCKLMPFVFPKVEAVEPTGRRTDNMVNTAMFLKDLGY